MNKEFTEGKRDVVTFKITSLEMDIVAHVFLSHILSHVAKHLLF